MRGIERALDAAEPGNVIALADGRYVGSFEVRSAGTASEPIFLRGGPEAVLDGGGVDAGVVLHLAGATGTSSASPLRTVRRA